MSNEFYLNKGARPRTQFTMFNGVGTLQVLTPTTSTKVVLTGLAIANNNAAGTMEFTWGSLNIDNRRIFIFFVGASAQIFPQINAIEGTMYDRGIYANVPVSSSYGWMVTAQGFELD